MSKSIASYPHSERAEVVARRIAGNSGGLGYWSAMGYAKAVKDGRATISAIVADALSDMVSDDALLGEADSELL